MYAPVMEADGYMIHPVSSHIVLMLFAPQLGMPVSSVQLCPRLLFLPENHKFVRFHIHSSTGTEL